MPVLIKLQRNKQEEEGEKGEVGGGGKIWTGLKREGQ